MINTVSFFNKTLKSLLVELKEWAPNDPVVKWARKTYIEAKADDPAAPQRAWRAFFTKHGLEARTAVENTNVEWFAEHVPSAGGVPELSQKQIQAFAALLDEQDKLPELWRFVGSLVLLADTADTLTDDSMSTIQQFAQQCAADLSIVPHGGDNDVAATNDHPPAPPAPVDVSQLDMGQMLERTTAMMPKMLEQMGLQVSQEEMDGAVERLKSGPMMGILSTLMKQV